MDLLDKITNPMQYTDYNNVFLFELVAKLLKQSNNSHTIKLNEGKQPFYGPIYSLKLIELKILKAYIKINLANNFT